MSVERVRIEILPILIACRLRVVHSRCWPEERRNRIAGPRRVRRAQGELRLVRVKSIICWREERGGRSQPGCPVGAGMDVLRRRRIHGGVKEVEIRREFGVGRHLGLGQAMIEIWG